MVARIAITRGNKVQYPILSDGATLTQSRRGSPAKLKFSIIKDADIDVQEGDPVLLQVDEASVFYGFVFEKSRKSGSPEVEITAYDQIRYLKNKDTFSYTATADGLLHMIASQYRLRVGDFAPTQYVLSRVESDDTLMDIVETALDETMQYTGNMYVLYDLCGKLCLHNVESLKLPLLVDASALGSYTYKSSIDKQTYNRVKITDEKGNPYVAEDAKNIAKWGVLQLTDSVKSTSGSLKAQTLLKAYNDKTRTLALSSVLGDTRVRAGCSIIVKLNLGDTALQNWMLIEQATHKFNDGVHLMDLKVRGGTFVV